MRDRTLCYNLVEVREEQTPEEVGGDEEGGDDPELEEGARPWSLDSDRWTYHLCHHQRDRSTHDTVRIQQCDNNLCQHHSLLDGVLVSLETAFSHSV